MAMKDWKKTGKDMWERSSMKGNTFRGEPGTDKIGIVKDLEKGYNVIIMISGGGMERKNFKTKQQALKYARNYMRKH